MGKSTIATISRVTSAICYFIAFVVMRTNKQNVEAGTVAFAAKYSHWNALQAVTWVSLIVYLYNFLVLILIPAKSKFWRTITLLDLVICIFSCATLGAGWQIYSLFIEGHINSIYANLSPICGVVPIFCLRTLVSLVSSTIGFLSLFLLNACCVGVSVGVFPQDS